MNQRLSVCGCDCSSCEHYVNQKCPGCDEIKGKVWWTSYISAEICPVYDCVANKRRFKHCGECAEIPCSLWRDLKDPGCTDEQHAASIKERTDILKNL